MRRRSSAGCVQRHVEEARAATGGERRRTRREPLPVGTAGIVAVHVWIDDTRERMQPAASISIPAPPSSAGPTSAILPSRIPMSARATLSGPTIWAPRTRTSKVPITEGEVIVSSMSRLERRIAVARGDEPADTVVRGGRVLSRLHARVARMRRRRSPTASSQGSASVRRRGDDRRDQAATSCPASSTPTCTSSR